MQGGGGGDRGREGVAPVLPLEARAIVRGGCGHHPHRGVSRVGQGRRRDAPHVSGRLLVVPAHVEERGRVGGRGVELGRWRVVHGYGLSVTYQHGHGYAAGRGEGAKFHAAIRPLFLRLVAVILEPDLHLRGKEWLVIMNIVLQM